MAVDNSESVQHQSEEDTSESASTFASASNRSRSNSFDAAKLTVKSSNNEQLNGVTASKSQHVLPESNGSNENKVSKI